MHWKDKPERISVKEGETLSFCRCGKTQKPPLCDGSHCGSNIEPYKIKFEKDQKVSICMCGKSSNMPFCDGSHRC